MGKNGLLNDSYLFDAPVLIFYPALVIIDLDFELHQAEEVPGRAHAGEARRAAARRKWGNTRYKASHFPRTFNDPHGVRGAVTRPR